jgi:4-amino-4-deoxy-L-arabinose transferase-like glycosyltransferase
MLTRAIARRLWGEHPATRMAPLILLGSFYWTVFCTSIMFDMLLGFFALASVYAVIRAWQVGRARYFALAGLALGFGILTKGPVVFLPALFAVLFAPWWGRGGGSWRSGWGRWFGSALGAAGIAALVAVAWLVPLALGSDIDYLKNLTLRQTGGYVVDSFAHRRPIWWYLAMVPLLLYPWSFWPRAWTALAAWRKMPDSGVRLCVVWAVAVLIAFSLVSAKQAHYPLLMFPAVALLLGRLLPEVDRAGDRSLLVPALVVMVLGAALIAVGAGLVRPKTAVWLAEAPAGPPYIAGAVLIAIGLAVAAARRMTLGARIGVLTAATCAAIVVSAWCVTRASGTANDIRAASAFVGRLEAQGAALAVAGGYHGQFNFYGRIRSRIERIRPSSAAQWAERHPEGYLVAFYPAGRWPAAAQVSPAYRSLYRSGYVAVWRARDVQAHPEIVSAFE